MPVLDWPLKKKGGTCRGEGGGSCPSTQEALENGENPVKGRAPDSRHRAAGGHTSSRGARLSAWYLPNAAPKPGSFWASFQRAWGQVRLRLRFFLIHALFFLWLPSIHSGQLLFPSLSLFCFLLLSLLYFSLLIFSFFLPFLPKCILKPWGARKVFEVWGCRPSAAGGMFCARALRIMSWFFVIRLILPR